MAKHHFEARDLRQGTPFPRTGPLWAGLLVLGLTPAPALPSGPDALPSQLVKEEEPDPRQVSPVGLCPGEEDLARLKSVEGAPRGKVLRVLGHPRAVKWKKDGTEVWDYPWM